MTDPDQHRAQAASFDRAADVYERSRPSYPADAIDWLLASVPRSALDLGAGTGKFTRLIAPRVESVVAVDPSERMLRELLAHVPTAEVRIGSAEAIPLSTASVDAVFCAQAWHWVDAPVAEREVARVLRAGGTFGLIWNVRDERVPWVDRLTAVIHDSKAERYIADPVVPESFGSVESFETTWSLPFTRESLLDLVESRSYVITADDAEKARIRAGVVELLDSDPDLGDPGEWRMPYRTLAFRMLRA